MSKIKVTQPVLNYEGKPFEQPKLDLSGQPVKDGEGKPEKEPQLLRDFLIAASNNRTQVESQTPMTHEQSMKVYRLTKRLYDKTNVELSVDERTFLRDQVAKFYSPAVVGFVTDVLFPDDAPKDELAGTTDNAPIE
jgi:hypothetical protein